MCYIKPLQNTLSEQRSEAAHLSAHTLRITGITRTHESDVEEVIMAFHKYVWQYLACVTTRYLKAERSSLPFPLPWAADTKTQFLAFSF